MNADKINEYFFLTLRIPPTKLARLGGACVHTQTRARVCEVCVCVCVCVCVHICVCMCEVCVRIYVSEIR